MTVIVQINGGGVTPWLIRRLRFTRAAHVLAMPAEHTSLAFLSPVIGSLRELIVTDPMCRDAKVAGEGRNLTRLDLLEVTRTPPVNLAQLTELQEFLGPAIPAFESVLALGNLRSLYISRPTEAWLRRLPQGIACLTLTSAPVMEASWMRYTNELERLVVHGAPRIALEAVTFERLERVSFESVGAIDGIAALRTARSLRSVTIENCSNIASLDELAQLPAEVRFIGPRLPASPHALRLAASGARGRWVLPPRAVVN